MKNFIILIMSIVFLFPTLILSAQKEKDCEIKVTLTKSDDNLSITIDSTFINSDCDNISFDSIVESIFGEMGKFDIYFNMDIDSAVNSALIWIEDSLDSHDMHKYIDIAIEKSMDFDFENLDSLISSNMIILKSELDSLSKEEFIDIKVFTDSLIETNGMHIIEIMEDIDSELENLETHVFYISGDGDIITEAVDEDFLIIKKVIKRSEDGNDEVEITYEIDTGSTNREINDDDEIIKRIIKKSGERGEQIVTYELEIGEDNIEIIDEDGHTIEKSKIRLDYEEEGIQKISIVDDGFPVRKSNVIKYKFNKKAFEVFDLSKKEKSMYSDVMDIKGKEKLKPSNLTIFPNPNNGKFKLSFNLNKDIPVTVIIYNINGEVIYENEIVSMEGKYSTNINIKPVRKGSYILKIKQGKKFKTKRLFVK